MTNIDIKGLKIQVHTKRYYFEIVVYYLIRFRKSEQILLTYDSLRHEKLVTDRIKENITFWNLHGLFFDFLLEIYQTKITALSSFMPNDNVLDTFSR